MSLLGPVVFALITSIGNALFVLGQKKALGVDSSFAFMAVLFFTIGNGNIGLFGGICGSFLDACS